MRGLLRDLPERVPVERLERLWLFAPREIAGKESGLVVLSLLPGPERPEGQRQVVTWRYEAERVRGKVRRERRVGGGGAGPGGADPAAHRGRAGAPGRRERGPTPGGDRRERIALGRAPGVARGGRG